MLIAAGCNSSSKLGGVRVNVIDLVPTDASLLETRAQMTLRYINENVFPLAINGSVHKLYLNGDYVGKTVSDQAVGLPRLSTATQTVTLLLENLAMVKKLQELTKTSSISYRLDSKVYLLVGEDTMTISSSSMGELDLSAARGTAQP